MLVIVVVVVVAPFICCPGLSLCWIEWKVCTPTMEMCRAMGDGSGVRVWKERWADGMHGIGGEDSLPSITSSTVVCGQACGNNGTDF